MPKVKRSTGESLPFLFSVPSFFMDRWRKQNFQLNDYVNYVPGEFRAIYAYIILLDLKTLYSAALLSFSAPPDSDNKSHYQVHISLGIFHCRPSHAFLASHNFHIFSILTNHFYRYRNVNGLI